ncbi:FAD-dependent oxidoreductase [Paucibacter sp. APW11]|uniref:FAD-dependent oxidoreductase n=1 Tax=Roseateles aquae TaxID=3077235 RepID=A0ABU3PDT1_9BURK|nr:FAD-dependent oxidoreductase [Paucibacter sp. APW11]MDT9000771.1 FAD-dependent oxidoreductase [Paucibacter sp. APW11]
MSQIAIAGAGLVGRLFAWALAHAGHQVRVFDARPGPEPLFDGQGAAAFTAAGMLSPLAELEQATPDIARLGWRSLQLWPQICAALSTPVRLRREGSLLLAHRQDQGAAARVLARLRQAGAGFALPEALEAAQLQQLEPALHAPGLQAWLLPGEGLIHPLQAMAALHGNSPGVDWQWNSAVIVAHHHRLELADGRRIDADWAIDARGLGARPALPLRGVRGEVVALELPAHGLQRPIRLMHPRHRIYLVPRSEHELLLGASEIESEDRSAVSLQTAVELMAAAHSLMPQLGEARITRLDRNLRPALPSNAPLSVAGTGLIQLNGLYRHGWLLAPALVQQLLEQTGLATLEIPT